jgi:hypothetical protein
MRENNSYKNCQLSKKTSLKWDLKPAEFLLKLDKYHFFIIKTVLQEDILHLSQLTIEAFPNF